MSAVPSAQSKPNSEPPLNVVVAANDAELDTTTDAPLAQPNPVKRIVDEIVGLMGLIHEEREELLARAIPFHTVNVMVEMGTNDKPDELAELKKTALAISRKQHGAGAITSARLDERIDALIALQHDMALSRKVVHSSGLSISEINNLTLMIRQNPGDGGEKSVNTFLAYAIACDIPVTKVEQMVADITAETTSVLPQITLDQKDEQAEAKLKLISDIAIGCVLTLIAMLLFT